MHQIKILIGSSCRLSKEALWTVKYAPQNLKELCGNSGMVEKLRQWLEAWYDVRIQCAM
jgi:replication factor C subunit 1